MPGLLIHIGTPKTGSTAIQYFLDQNRECLRAMGINYLRSGRRNNAHNRLIQARRSGDMKSAMSKVIKEIQADPEMTHILSSEMFSTAGMAADFATTLPDDIRQQTRILAYLRRQDKYLEAVYKQRLKTNRSDGTAHQFYMGQRNKVDYIQMLAPWTDAFGQDNIIVRPFERSQFPEGNIVADVANLLGLDGIKGFAVRERSDNVTFSIEVTRLLSLIRRTTDINTKTVIRHLSVTRPPEAIRSNDCFTKAERLDIMTRYEAANDTLRKTYCADLPMLFDQSDLAPDAPDPFPDPQDRLDRFEHAQEIVFQAIGEIRAAELAEAAQ